MKLDYIRYSLSNIAHRKTRSFLTSLSILIGIMAIYTLVSFGLGLQVYVDSVAQEAGVDKLFVQAKGVGAPGTDANFQLTQDDADFVEKVRGVNEVAPIYMKAGEISHKDQKKYRYTMGFDMEHVQLIEEAWSIKIIAGRGLKDGELGKVALGYNYQLPNKAFKKPLRVGDKLELNGHPIEVVGFYEEFGNPSDDENIYLTKEGFEELYPETIDEYAFFMVRAEKDMPAEELGERITVRLGKHKGQEEGKEDFFVQTFQDALATFNNIINVLNAILYIIALISVIVAGVNIMNTMYTSVLERTKEIGIMKAIGATNDTILFIFIFEAGFLGLVGGVLGVFLGWLVASAGGQIAAASGFALLKPVFPWFLTAGCMFFAFAVGAISGILPAKQAAGQKPVDALRYE